MICSLKTHNYDYITSIRRTELLEGDNADENNEWKGDDDDDEGVFGWPKLWVEHNFIMINANCLMINSHFSSKENFIIKLRKLIPVPVLELSFRIIF